MELDALEDEVTPQRVRLLEARLKVHFARIQELEDRLSPPETRAETMPKPRAFVVRTQSSDDLIVVEAPRIDSHNGQLWLTDGLNNAVAIFAAGSWIQAVKVKDEA